MLLQFRRAVPQEFVEGELVHTGPSALVDDAACNFDSGGAGYLTQNLVEAGVVCRDGESGIGISLALGPLWRQLRRSGRILGDSSGWCCRQGGKNPGVWLNLRWSC